MNSSVQIFMRDEDKSSFPSDIYADMAPIYGTRCATQWLFYLLIKGIVPNVGYSSSYPKDGILFIHRSDVDRFVWNKDLFIVSLQWDFTVDQRAHIHVVSNEFRENKTNVGWFGRNVLPGFCCYVPPVMHPTVKPRSPERGDTFENVVYMGAPRNLDPAFKTDDFRARIQALEMRLIIEEDPKKHDDFSEVDVALAVREVGKLNTMKPAVKLYNAWRGGVPALLGLEIGFREERQSELDYIEVDSPDDVIHALEKLKTDIDYRHRMIGNAVSRGEAYTPEGQQQNWATFIESYVYPEYEKWKKRSVFSKQCSLFVRWIRYVFHRGFASVFKKFLGRS